MARTASIAVGGYYPTPQHLVSAIAAHLRPGTWSGHTVSTLCDPCAGEGSAAIALARDIANTDTSTNAVCVYANEAEASRFLALRTALDDLKKATGWSHNVTHADAFTLGVSGGCTDLLYLNPPYDTDKVHGRLEQKFLARFRPMLAEGGVLVFVVPIHALKASAAYIGAHFENVRVFRFPNADYQAYKQVVLYGVALEDERAGAAANATTQKILQIVDAGPEALPLITDTETHEPYPIPTRNRYGMFHPWSVRPVDTEAIVAAYVPHATNKAGVRAATWHPPIEEISLAKFDSATLPRPAHIASGIAAGIFDGVQLRPTDPNAGLPNILVKGVFRREYTDVDEKRNKAGEVTKIVQVQRPVLEVHYLDLSTGAVGTFAPATERTESRTLDGASVGDMMAWYSNALVEALYQHCNVLHDANNASHQVPIFPLRRPLYKAQEQAAMALYRLLGGDKARTARQSALLLAEVGTGKSAMSLATCATIGARKILVFCPPHLLDGWREQARFAFRDVNTHVLSEPQDVDAFAALPRTDKFEIAILSREAAKLGHGYESVQGRCPACGAKVPTGDLASKRAVCEHRTYVGTTDYAKALLAVASTAVREFAGTPLAALLPTRMAERADTCTEPSKLPRADRNAVKALLLPLIDGYTEYGNGDNTALCQSLIRWLNEPEWVLGQIVQRVQDGLSRLPEEERTLDGYNQYRIRAAIQPSLWLAEVLYHCIGASGTEQDQAWFRASVPPLVLKLSPGLANDFDPEESGQWLDASTSSFATAIKVAVNGAAKQIMVTTCGERLYQAAATPRRYPLAKYISRRYPDFADALILDEVHELATSGAAQEIAGHRLAKMGWPTLYLTGSLMNGYASSLFSNFWNISPAFRAEFDHDEGTLFQKTYGYYKRTVDVSDGDGQVTRGKQSERKDQRGRTSQATEAPGVLPSFIIRYLLRAAVTLQKNDLDLDIPPCTEVPTAIAPDPELAAAHALLADTLVTQIKEDAFTDRAGQLFGAMAELPSHLDRSAVDTGNERGGDFVIAYPDGTEVARAAPVFTKTTMSAKERWLVETVQAEMAAGRNVLVLTYHTNLMARVARLVESNCSTKVVQLLAAKVPTHARQQWINDTVVTPGIRIMVANPTTIQTGLNNLVHFATEIFLENPACNPLVYRQAIGRIHRIGQKLPSTVFFPYYTDTVQVAARKLLDDKVRISLATDGIDPEEALSAAGVGDGVLAAAMSVGRELYKSLTSND